MPIRVEVSPQYIDEKNYKVTGVITLNEETAVPFEGEVFGGDTQLYVLTEPIILPNFEAEFSYRGDRWTLSGAPTRDREDGYGPGQVPWYVGFGPVVDSSVGVRYQTTLKPAD